MTEFKPTSEAVEAVADAFTAKRDFSSTPLLDAAHAAIAAFVEAEGFEIETMEGPDGEEWREVGPWRKRD